MPEFDLTFKKRFKLRDDQRPEEVANCYIRSMGFEFIRADRVANTPEECVRQYENRIPCGGCGHVHLGCCSICNNCEQILPALAP